MVLSRSTVPAKVWEAPVSCAIWSPAFCILEWVELRRLAQCEHQMHYLRMDMFKLPFSLGVLKTFPYSDKVILQSSMQTDTQTSYFNVSDSQS